MAKVEIYDKPMCCSTGICGPEVDPVLPRFAADLDWLKSAGHEVERFNLAHQPAAIAENGTVQKALAAGGVESLPLVIVDGQVVSSAAYPSRKQLASWAAGTNIDSTVESAALPIADTPSKCCGNETKARQ